MSKLISGAVLLAIAFSLPLAAAAVRSQRIATVRAFFLRDLRRKMRQP